MPKLDEYVRIAEAAEYLGVCENTLRDWKAAGKSRVRRNPLNRYRFFKLSGLDELRSKIELWAVTQKRKPRKARSPTRSQREAVSAAGSAAVCR